MLVSKSSANLAGGVSQQSAPQRLFNQAEEQENFYSGLVNGLQSRPPLVKIQSGGQRAAAFYKIERDADHKYNLLISPYGIKVSEQYGDWTDVAMSDAARNYLSISASANPYMCYKTLTLADHTFILNSTKTVSMSDEQASPWTDQALLFIKQVNYATTWTVVINGISKSVGYTNALPSTGNANLYVNGENKGPNHAPDSVEVTTLFFEQFSSLSGFSITQKGSVLWIRRTDGGSFTIGASDSRSDTCINLATYKIQNFSDLPTVAPNGYVCKIIGEIASTADEYYVKFVTNNGDAFSKGIWEETVAPGSKLSLDANTMPWALVHQNGEWSFEPFSWDSKEIGDDESCPVPSFVGKCIRNLFYYRNRLCFLAEEQFCMSRAGRVGNWWNETASTLSDGDPIFIDCKYIVDR